MRSRKQGNLLCITEYLAKQLVVATYLLQFRYLRDMIVWTKVYFIIREIQIPMTFKIGNSLGFLLNRTNTRMKNNLLHHFKDQDYDVTPEQWAVLNRLWEREGISPKELAELTSKDQPTTVRMLAKLEKKGFIKRKVNPEDSRTYQIFLTSEGRALKDQLFPLAFEALGKALKGIDKEQIEQVKIVLNKIFKNLGG